MSEESLKDYVLRGMKPHWVKGVKHADAFTAGIADVSGFITGVGTVWIELKAITDWPKRPATPVNFGMDELQRAFLWGRQGWLFVRVRREYLLFDYRAAQNEIDLPFTTKARALESATKIWRNSVNWKELARCLSLKT